MSAPVLLLGAGKVGRMIATLLDGTNEFSLCVADQSPDALDRLGERLPAIETRVLDVTDGAALRKAMHGCAVAVSALNFHVNPLVAEAALDVGASYFDLTDDRTGLR